MQNEPGNKTNTRHNHLIAVGVVLILLGLGTLLQTWLDIGNYVVLLLGLAMLAWGSYSRRTGWIIPGGVLTGIGLGILATEGPWHFPAADQSGIFLLCFAFGWFLIALLSGLFTCLQWWALIPGGIMALIGGSVVVTNGMIRLEDLNVVYAIILIVIGGTLLVYRGRPKKNE
ncbi:MAG TPA: hypothetical protein VMC09_17205 [Anaerolineales bacterium]|nr:hypothetical protein [Anaerolineales bacterium]